MTDARYPRDADAYEQMVRNLLGEFRIDFGRCAGDPKFEQLDRGAARGGARFPRLWSRVELWSSPRAVVVQHESSANCISIASRTCPSINPAIRVVMFIPGEPHTARVIANLERPWKTRLRRGTGCAT